MSHLMRLLHESFNAIIAILHVKIETKQHSLKVHMTACFHPELVYKHNFFANKLTN